MPFFPGLTHTPAEFLCFHGAEAASLAPSPSVFGLWSLSSGTVVSPVGWVPADGAREVAIERKCFELRGTMPTPLHPHGCPFPLIPQHGARVLGLQHSLLPSKETTQKSRGRGGVGIQAEQANLQAFASLRVSLL